jgi:hypothetical protein
VLRITVYFTGLVHQNIVVARFSRGGHDNDVVLEELLDGFVFGFEVLFSASAFKRAIV